MLVVAGAESKQAPTTEIAVRDGPGGLHMRAVIVLLSLLLFVLQSAEAKSRILLLGGTPENCKDEFLPIRRALVSLPIPDDWTFVVTCSPTVWDNLLRRTDGMGKTHTAFTNLDTHYTFFNGSNFAPRVAAHELGHILGHTTDHEKAEATGVTLLQRRNNTAANKK